MNCLSHESIVSLLPFGPEWTLIDRVLDWQRDLKIITERHVPVDDRYACSHFISGPKILPGVLLIEFIGQSAYLLSRLSSGPLESVPILAKCRARFLAPACAGDTLIAEVAVSSIVNGISVCEGTVRANDRELCRVQTIGRQVQPHVLRESSPR
jgi:3-hydroxyacyl-[acyl-carrier-protein] dehydratase